jgi:hypothetical protein
VPTLIAGLRDLISRGLLVLFGAWAFAAHPEGSQITGTFVMGAGILAVDQIGFGGGIEALVLDTLAQATSPSYKNRLQLHEAAHFLVAYLMGILPKGYTLSSLDAYDKYGALNVQAGCAFCDGAFQREVARGGGSLLSRVALLYLHSVGVLRSLTLDTIRHVSLSLSDVASLCGGKIGAGSLGRFSCVALAGISMEYIAYGFAEGGVADVGQLDGMLRALAGLDTTFHHVTLQSKHIQLMTAGMVRVDNLTSPGRQCNPARWLSRKRRATARCGGRC